MGLEKWSILGSGHLRPEVGVHLTSGVCTPEIIYITCKLDLLFYIRFRM